MTADGDPHRAVLERQLSDVGVLDHPDQLADPLGLRRLERIGVAVRHRAPAAKRLDQPRRVVSEEREEQQVLLARSSAGARLQVVHVGRLLGRPVVVGERSRDVGDLHRRRAVPAAQEPAHLGRCIRPSARREHVAHGLHGEDAADRLRERGHAAVLAHPRQLVEHLVQAVGRIGRAKAGVDLGHEPDRDPVERRPQGDPRRDRKRRHLRGDVVVDEPRRCPDLCGVDAVLDPEPGEGVAEELGRDPVQGGGDRVRGGGDRLGAAPRGLDRHRERVPARPLAVEPDRHAGRLGKPRDDLAARPRVERSGRVVEQHVIGPELRQTARLLDDPLEVRHRAREREPRVQPSAGLADRRRRRGEVLDVVHGVVQAEDVDAALGSRQDEPPDQVVGDRAAARPGTVRAARSEAASSSSGRAGRGSVPTGSRRRAGRQRRSTRRPRPRGRRSRRRRGSRPPRARAPSRWCP